MPGKGQRIWVALLTLLLFGIVVGPWVLPSPLKLDVLNAFAPPGSVAVLGTDELGRSILARVATGLRYSLGVAVLGTLLGALVGISVGLSAGYFGGLLDRMSMRMVDIQIVIPQLLFAMVVVSVLGPSFATLVIALSLSCWTAFARVTRAQVLVLRQQEMVAAMITVGMSRTRLLLLHVLPNISGALTVLSTLEVAHLILAEAALGYLGLGIPPPSPTLGRMIADGTSALLSGIWWPALVPGVVVSLLILSISQLGDWFQARLDPRQQPGLVDEL